MQRPFCTGNFQKNASIVVRTPKRTPKKYRVSQFCALSSFFYSQVANNYFVRAFETLAVGVLIKCDEYTDDSMNGVIFFRVAPHFKIDLMEMAIRADCKTLISLPAIQNVCNDIWNGDLEIFKFAMVCTLVS